MCECEFCCVFGLSFSVHKSGFVLSVADCGRLEKPNTNTDRHPGKRGQEMFSTLAGKTSFASFVCEGEFALNSGISLFFCASFLNCLKFSTPRNFFSPVWMRLNSRFIPLSLDPVKVPEKFALQLKKAQLDNHTQETDLIVTRG